MNGRKVVTGVVISAVVVGPVVVMAVVVTVVVAVVVVVSVAIIVAISVVGCKKILEDGANVVCCYCIGGGGWGFICDACGCGSVGGCSGDGGR